MNTVPTQNRSGFSLLELMVALAIGGAVAGSVYYIGGASSHHFHEQQRIGQTQLSLRLAMDQLRRDIARAGFLGTPNSRTDRLCRTPANAIQAVEFINDADTASIPQAAAHNVQADRLRLTGNYATAEEYLGQLNAGGSSVTLQTSWQGFRRSFVSRVSGNPFVPDLFTAAFRVGRMIRIVTPNNFKFFVTVTNVNAAAASISFNPPIGTGGPCIGGFAVGSQIAPVMRIEYLVTNIGGNLAAVDATGSAAIGADSVQLVRREIDFAGAAIANSERIVAEHVVDFNLSFVFDEAAAGNAPVLVRRTGDDPNTAALLANSPQSVRSIIATLSVRTGQQDAKFPYVARAAGAPLTRYRANPNSPGAARVRTIQTEIFLPNLLNQ